MAGPPANPRYAAGVFLAVIDPEWFGGRQAYARLVAEISGQARAFDGVLLPGDPERAQRRLRARDGIRLPRATWQELAALGDRFGVALPAA